MDEQIVRIPPHDTAAERSVLGSMIINNELIANIQDTLSKEDFFERANALVYEGIINLFNAGKSVDLITLKSQLESMNVIDSVSDISFLGSLADSVAISANAGQYADIVRDKALLRRLIQASDIIANECYRSAKAVEDIVDKAEKQIYDIAQNKHEAEYTPIGEILESVIMRIDELAKNKGQLTGISTGFIDLDDRTSGLQNSDLILIAARPSMGKTAFALNIAQHVAVREGKTTAIFSLEMSKEQLVQRMLATSANVSMSNIRNATLNDSDYEEIVNKVAELAGSKLIIDDSSGITVGELRRKCRKYKMDENLGLVVIDYLQLMSGSMGESNRQQEVANISRSLKQLARELDIPIIALSQLSRAVEQRAGDHRPLLSDLRESGSIEQDADIVMFIYREDRYDPETPKKNVAEIIIAKQRNGPVGTVELTWIPEFTKFADMVKL